MLEIGYIVHTIFCKLNERSQSIKNSSKITFLTSIWSNLVVIQVSTIFDSQLKSNSRRLFHSGKPINSLLVQCTQ